MRILYNEVQCTNLPNFSFNSNAAIPITVQIFYNKNDMYKIA